MKVPFSFLVAVPATLYVVHVSFEPAKKAGEIHGLLKRSDLNEQVKPALATAYAAEIALDTSAGSRGATALSLFDSDKDGVVTAQEVQDNQILQTSFAPDIDAFDAAGKFAPSVDGLEDSLSVGIGFSAQPCNF